MTSIRDSAVLPIGLVVVTGLFAWITLPGLMASGTGTATIPPIIDTAQAAMPPMGPPVRPGTLAHTVTPLNNVSADGIANIVRDPSDILKPLGNRAPSHVKVQLETKELVGKLDDGSTYTYWTFNGKVPGPFVRVRVGDEVEVDLTNDKDSSMMHSVDFHAVTGPGGGAKATEAAPGETSSFEFQPTHPGLYVYHCAVPMAAEHIANGMYGLILVEPEGGLQPVDHEFYVMQGEIYTEQPFGTQGALTESYQKLMDEKPEYFVFNGAVGALTKVAHMNAKVGETVRIFFGNAGPNETSSFHVIGEVFDRLYQLGSLTSPPLTDVQTATVPPGGAAMVEFKVDVPGNYTLVDHAITRVQRGLSGVLTVTGPENTALYNDKGPARSAMVVGH
jgi:nitrite reductase (NO-forming)